MPRGTIAKENIVNKLKTALGTDFIGEYNKKYYCWADDGGDKIQIAITLTCPKEQIEAVSPGGWLDFSDNPATLGASTFTPAEFTEEERATVTDMLKRLGL